MPMPSSFETCCPKNAQSETSMSSRRPSLRLARVLDRLDRRKRAARKAAAAARAAEQTNSSDSSTQMSTDEEGAGRGSK